MKNCDRRDPAHCMRPIAKSRQAAHVPKWRNWQTRYIQGVVPVREWRFESSLRHQFSFWQDPPELESYSRNASAIVPRAVERRSVDTAVKSDILNIQLTGGGGKA